MGGCFGRLEEEASEKDINLLLLGAPGVGKSTIFKQLKMLYESGFSDPYREEVKRLILIAIVMTMEVILEVCAQTGNEIPATDPDVQRLKGLVAICDTNANNKPEEVLEQSSLDECVLRLYKHSSVQNALELLRKGEDERIVDIELPDSGIYFLSRLEDISAPDYVPSDADVLRLRRITNEAEPIRFTVPMEWPPNSREMRNIGVRCTDVGGQAHHEYDWVQYGRGCEAILFVATLSHFCKVDSDGENALVKQLHMLRRVANAEAFKDKQIVLLFNKSDLLGEQLKRHRVSAFFKSYTGPNTEDAVFEFFRKKCMALMKNGNGTANRETSIVRTCALDATMMEQVLTRVLLALFRTILRDNWTT